MKIRITITLLLLVLVMVFAIQNSAIVELKFLIWEVSFPRSLLIFLMLLVGIVVGWFSRAMLRFAGTGRG